MTAASARQRYAYSPYLLNKHLKRGDHIGQKANEVIFFRQGKTCAGAAVTQRSSNEER